MKEFHLQIVTPDGVKFDGEALSVLAKCEGGDVEIMAGHADLFATLEIGKARIKTKDSARVGSCAGGFISVFDGEVKIVATTFEYADEIDRERAERARTAAEAAIKEASDTLAIEKAKLKLSRALNRIKVSELK